MKYSPRRQPWWNAVKRARSKRARAASQDAAVATQRLPAFRFLHLCLESLIWRSSTEDRKAGPTPALSLDRTGFAFDVTLFCWRALHSRSRAEKTRAPRRAAR